MIEVFLQQQTALRGKQGGEFAAGRMGEKFAAGVLKNHLVGPEKNIVAAEYDVPYVFKIPLCFGQQAGHGMVTKASVALRGKVPKFTLGAYKNVALFVDGNAPNDGVVGNGQAGPECSVVTQQTLVVCPVHHPLFILCGIPVLRTCAIALFGEVPHGWNTEVDALRVQAY